MSKNSTLAARLVSLLALFLISALSGAAQSQATTGNIEGNVLDPNGAAVPGISVTATNQDTGFSKSTSVNEDGYYRITFLPPGKYKVVTSGGQGFTAASFENAIVTVGGQTRLDIQLTVSGTTAMVDISVEGQIVETTRTSISSTVNERAIENLPVNGRNYLDFATLTPGVVRDPTRQGDLAVGGQKGTLNSLQVDGADNNNTFFGQSFGRTGTRPPYQFSEESVQEFQVNQNGFSAEFGRAGGAVINVVTKSGTNQWHGSAFEYFRDESLNSNTPGLTARGAKRPKSQINQFGGTLGGPISKDRAFLFFAYDGQRSSVPNVVDPPNFLSQPANIQALLLPLLNTYEVGRNQDVVMVKGDIRLNDANQLVLRFNQQNFTGNNNENGGPLSVEEHSGNSVAKTTTFSGSLTSTLSSSLINEFRFQFGRDREPGEANSDLPEARIQTIGGFLQLGRNNFSPRETTIKRVQFIDNVSYAHGNHNWKFGYDVNFDRIFNFFPGLFSGQFTFNSPSGQTAGYSNFADNVPASYTQNFAGQGTSGATTHPNSKELGLFVQDDWRVTPKLTFNLGLRYDVQKLDDPAVFNADSRLASNSLGLAIDTSTPVRDNNNFSPRAGFSYAFNQNTVLRGGYGVFFGRTPAIMLATAHSQNGIQVTGVSLTCTAVANPCPVYPNIFTTPPSAGGLTPSLYLFATDYAQPYVQQGRLGVERELWADMSLSVSYLYYRGVHLSRTRDINLNAPVATTLTVLGSGETFTVLRHPVARPISGFTRISLFESTANSRYNALAVELKRRLSRGLQFIMAYTFSNSKDDRPDQTMVVVGTDDFKGLQNNLDIRSDWGRSDLDIRHRFVFSPVYDVGAVHKDNALVNGLLGNWGFSSIITMQSGFAYSALISGDANRDGNPSTNRVPGTERNGFTTPNIYVVDARITKSFRFGERYNLSLIGEAFNLFNRSNVATVNTGRYGISSSLATTLTNPAATTPFGAPRTFLGERQIQLAARFRF
ncbi:MAG TPA: TonB-dependent receptor [Pyrinomonadaceae bacterium]|nr:TonB-dependent receptor [Pyrinomonadaceae bacterium]